MSWTKTDGFFHQENPFFARYDIDMEMYSSHKRGFRMAAPGGWSISTQWGVFNYCENRSFLATPGSYTYTDGKIDLGPLGCNTAELGIYNPGRSFCDLDLAVSGDVIADVDENTYWRLMKRMGIRPKQLKLTGPGRLILFEE